MAEDAAGAAVQVLVQGLISLLSEEMKLVRGFEDDLAKLQNSLSMTQKYLSDAEKKEINDEAVKEWLKQLEDVTFEADAVLDEFNYQLLQKKVKNQKRETKEVSSCSFSSGSSTSLGFRRKMARKINDVNKKLETINKDAANKGLQMAVVSAHDASTIGLVETDSFSESNVVGRENDVAEIVGMIVNSPLHEKISLIPIVGMGGLGKTTLARKIFHHEEINTRFEKRIWVCVSFHFDEVTLFQTILKTLTGEDVQGIVTKEVVLQKIHTDLIKKRYLIILDDLWNEDFKKWDDFMKSLLGISNVTQNVIVVTTRQETVASIVRTLSLYKLRSMSKDDCWSIIKSKALSSMDDPLEYEEIGKSIAQKCGGLPLAANVIGGMLRGKPKDEWSSILINQLSNFGRDDDNHVMKILKLSYNRLPSSSLKRCFAYCSIFPQDFEIHKETLIEQWLAEGFLQTNQGNDHLENIGNDFFNHLLHASLIQESKRDHFGNVTDCRMHDFVHDLACSISGYRSKIVENDSGNDMNKVRYLYLTSYEPYHISKVRAKYLRTLIFNGEVANNTFSGLSCLHVLKLNSDIEELPILIGEQKHLRFLDISSTRIKYLPDSVSKLSNLQTLVVTNLPKLPNTIIELLNLRHLHISCIELPPFIGKLTSLQMLPYYKVGLDNGCRIGELENLKNLKGSLEIQNIERVEDKGEAEHADLFGKSNISKLVLVWTKRWAISRENGINDENVLEGLQPHPNLKSFEVRGYESRNFPSWTMKMTVYNAIEGRCAELNNLVEIILEDCGCEKIPNLGHLPSLKFLKLKRLLAVQSIGLSFFGLEICSTSSAIDDVNIPRTTIGFPALQKLYLLMMLNLMEWAYMESRVANFPCLEYLEINSCPKLKTAPTHFPSLKELVVGHIGSNVSLTNICNNTSSLQRLEILSYSGIIHLGDGLFVKNRDLSTLVIEDCPNLTASSELPKDLSTLQSLKVFRISKCAELKSIPNFDLTSLQDLFIDNCAELKSIPNFDSSLRQLSITKCPALTCLQRELLESCTPSLEILSLSQLPNVENMDTVMSCIWRMSRLEMLCLVKLPKLTYLPTETGCFRSLWMLEIGGFPGSFDVVSFNDYFKRILHESHHLKILFIDGNEDWGSLPDHIQRLDALVTLRIQDYGIIEALPEWIGNLSSLRSLWIRNCKRLRHLPSKESMQRLTKLSIENCPLLKVERCSSTQQQSTPSGADYSEWPKISHIQYIGINGQQLTRNSPVQAPHVQDEKKFAGCFPIPQNRRR